MRNSIWLKISAIAITAVMATLLILSVVAPIPSSMAGTGFLSIGTSQRVSSQTGTNGMAYAKVNKSGCIVRKGNCQIRLDFYLEPADPRYSDKYLHLVDTTSPEWLAGYQGKVDKFGNPIDQEDYDKWVESLPHVWQNTPFHTHFIYLPCTFTDEDIKAAIDLHLPNFYQAFQDHWDDGMCGMRHGWDVTTRKRPKDYSKTDTIQEYNVRVSECQDAINVLTEFQHKPEGGIKGRTFPSTDIAVGCPAIEKASTFVLSNVAAASTLINEVGAANGTGSIDAVDIYIKNREDGNVLRVGSFIDNGSNSLTCHDTQEIGEVDATGLKEFTGLDFDIDSGEYIGADGKTLGKLLTIAYASSGGSGCWSKPSVAMCDVDDTETCTHYADYYLSLYGTGETAAAEPAITNAPDNYGFGTLEVAGTGNTAINYFTITNTGNCAVDVTIQGTDLTGPASFNPITPVDVTPGSSATWVDVDVSAYLPVGATGAILHLVNDYSSTIETGLRKNGSTDDRHAQGAIKSQTHTWAMIGVDSSRIFETYLEILTNVTLYLVGYTTEGVTFFTNGYDKTPGTLGSWQDIDCSSEAPNAIGLIFEITTTTEEPKTFGMRKKGSTDSRTNMNEGHATFTTIIGCDANQVCQAILSVAGTLRVHLIGYVTSGAVFNTNATDLSLGSTGSWTDLSALPSGATMGFLEVETSTIADYGLRKNGSSEEIYEDAFYHPWAFVQCDENRIIEGKISSTNVDFFLVGYALNVSSTWTLSDTAVPGENIYGLYAGLDDADDLFDVIVRKTETYNTLVSDLAEDATQDWGLKIYMPTSLSGYDNQQMTATITLVASEAT